MNGINLFLILCSVVLNSIAQLMLKASVNSVVQFSCSHFSGIMDLAIKLIFQWSMIGGLSCYAISLIFWLVVLSRLDISIAYPMLSLGYVINAFIASYWFGEIVTKSKLIGISIILIGVFILTRN